MIRPITCLAFLLACGSGLYVYQAKHRVKVLDDQIAAIVKSTDALREQTRMLSAEWTLLNDPERLRKLANQFLTLQTVSPSQFTSLADLDSRLPPPLPHGAPPAPTEAAPVVAEQAPAIGAAASGAAGNAPAAGHPAAVAALPVAPTDAGGPTVAPPPAKNTAIAAARDSAPATKPEPDTAKLTADAAAPRHVSDGAPSRLAGVTATSRADDRHAGSHPAPPPPRVADNREPRPLRRSPDVHEVAQRTFIPRTLEPRPVVAARLPRPMPAAGSFLGMASDMPAPPAPMPMPRPMPPSTLIPYGGSGG